MEHLLRGYESSSSTSHCSPSSSSECIFPQRLTKNNDEVNGLHITRHNEQDIKANAVAQDPPDNHISGGNSSHREESSFDTREEKTNSFNKRGGEGRVNNCSEQNSVKRRKVINESSIPRVIIEGENHVDCSGNTSSTEEAFERTIPHWEGRWAGHLFLPFPPLHQLDASEEREEPDVEAAATTSCPDESDNSSDDSQGSDATGEEDDMTLPQSRAFLPAVRVLINCWAFMLQNSFETIQHSGQLLSDQSGSYEESTITVIPHVPMKSDWTKDDDHTSSALHASLSRPIYLPAPSVDSFLSSIQKCITTVVTATKSNTNSNPNGRIFHLEPHAAAIFTNDKQNRSFLTIPITGQNATWVKRALLPPIDAAMKKFGLQSYYAEEGCIIHVSVASVKGNMVKRMIQAGYSDGSVQVDANTRSLQLLPCMQHISASDQSSEFQLALQSIPRLIPVQLDRVQCQFGKVKGVSIKF